jgi:hypothetical protein
MVVGALFVMQIAIVYMVYYGRTARRIGNSKQISDRPLETPEYTTRFELSDGNIACVDIKQFRQSRTICSTPHPYRHAQRLLSKATKMHSFRNDWFSTEPFVPSNGISIF